MKHICTFKKKKKIRIRRSHNATTQSKSRLMCSCVYKYTEYCMEMEILLLFFSSLFPRLPDIYSSISHECISCHSVHAHFSAAQFFPRESFTAIETTVAKSFALHIIDWSHCMEISIYFFFAASS